MFRHLFILFMVKNRPRLKASRDQYVRSILRSDEFLREMIPEFTSIFDCCDVQEVVKLLHLLMTNQEWREKNTHNILSSPINKYIDFLTSYFGERAYSPMHLQRMSLHIEYTESIRLIDLEDILSAIRFIYEYEVESSRSSGHPMYEYVADGCRIESVESGSIILNIILEEAAKQAIEYFITEFIPYIIKNPESITNVPHEFKRAARRLRSVVERNVKLTIKKTKINLRK